MRSAATAVLFLLALSEFPYWRAATAINDLRVAFQWKQTDYDWPSNDMKKLFSHYQQENNLPLGLEVTQSRIFVTVPRWKLGVASSLNYFYANDTRESPPLIPYPSWEAHQYGASGAPEIVSVFRVRADRCDRLWVLDTGLADILGNPEQQAPPALLIYDLKTDRLLRKFVIPADQRTSDSLFANIAVEDYNCDDSYGYLGDLGGPCLVVYSWQQDKSWVFKHSFFEADPKGGEFNVSGVWFQWADGIFGMALAPMNNGYSTLYFHPLSSSMEFSISTEALRDESLASMSEKFSGFRALGSRGNKGQSGVSFFDPSTGVLFYALPNLNAVACWRPQETFTKQQQGMIYMDNVTMVFPNDLKVDRDGNMWVLSDRLPTFLYSHLDPDDYNFRILTGSTAAAIKGTACAGENQPTTIKNEARHLPDENTNNETVDEKSSASVESTFRSLVIAGTLLSLFLARFTRSYV